MLPPGRGPVRRQCGALSPGACPLVTYVRTYVRTYFFRICGQRRRSARQAMRRRGPARIRTYVRTWRVHRWRLRIMSWAVVSWDPPFIGLPDDDDDERRRRRQRGGGLVSDLRTVACVRTWRMFPRPYVRTHTLRGSVHACSRASDFTNQLLY